MQYQILTILKHWLINVNIFGTRTNSHYKSSVNSNINRPLNFIISGIIQKLPNEYLRIYNI